MKRPRSNARVKKRFKRIYVEISNICNIQCSFCPIVERPKEIMSLEHYQKILNQMIPLTDDICLHLMGEPLAHPKISEIMQQTSESGGKVQITTNGLLIQKLGKMLLAQGSLRQINFSLQAFKDNFPDRPISGYLDPIIEFTKECFIHRPDVYINYRMWNFGDKSFKENKELITYLEEKLRWNNLNSKVDVAHIKSKKVFKDRKLYLHFDSRFEWPSAHFPIRSERGTCLGLRNHFGIHADGSLVPCCLDKEAVITLGNVFEDSIESIIDSDRAVSMREGFERGELVDDLCKRCTFIQRFDSKLKENN